MQIKMRNDHVGYVRGGCCCDVVRGSYEGAAQMLIVAGSLNGKQSGP